LPAEFETYHNWDFTKFGRGERFVYKTVPHSEFDEVMKSGQALGPRSVPQGQDLRRLGRTLTRKTLDHRNRVDFDQVVRRRHLDDLDMVEAGAGGLKYSRRTLWIFSKCSMLRT